MSIELEFNRFVSEFKTLHNLTDLEMIGLLYMELEYRKKLKWRYYDGQI